MVDWDRFPSDEDTLAAFPTLSTRARTCVRNELWQRELAMTLENVASITRKEWLRVMNVGKVIADELEHFVGQCGLSLGAQAPMISISHWGMFPTAAEAGSA